jgi:hypothetical protein
MAASEFKQHTHWSAVGTSYSFEITGIRARGAGEHYTPTQYELTWSHKPQIQLKSPAEMQELLNENKIKRIA